MTTIRHNIDSDLLTRTAFEILVSDLEGHGNRLSAMHRAALFELVHAFAGYCTGEVFGRRAYPLPCGMGKTSAICAFVTALHRLGYRVPVAVAASRVEALSALKRDMLAHGVPESDIGLKHSLRPTEDGAILPSTGSESRLVQMVTHARVRMEDRAGEEFRLFATYEDQPRALMLYDETFLRSDSFALSARNVRAGVAVLESGLEEGAAGASPLRALAEYLKDSTGRIAEALRVIREKGDPECNGVEVRLGELAPETVEAFQDQIAHQGRWLRGFEADLRSLLEVSQQTLRLVGTEQGDAVITAREVIPLALRDVVILDASAPIRELARLDPTVQVVESFDAAELKSFERVEVRQLLSPGGRHSIETSLRADREETSAVAREVAQVIREGWEKERAFLVFTFVRRASFDAVEELRRGLRRAGIDLEAKTSDGRDRIRFLTWGSETSTNGLEDCTSVIMAGVLHRSHLDLASAVRGQTGNPTEPTPSARIRDLVESELAHCILQGASRGSCRRIEDGKAQAMRLWFIHRSPDIRRLLDRVMPGAVWSYPEPRYLKKASADSKAAQMLGLLLDYLRGLPEGQTSVSSMKTKQGMGLPKDKATEHAFTRAVGLLDLQDHGWCLQGRSLVRPLEAHGFCAEN